MYYDKGKVVTCAQNPQGFCGADDLHRAAAPEGCRHRPARSLQMVEFAYGPTGHNPHYGAVRNPGIPTISTGARSSGSGSAVAARLTFCRGSAPTPAARSGCRAFLRSHGAEDHRQPRQPRRRDALSWTLYTVGPLARTVETVALLTGLMAAPIPRIRPHRNFRCRTTWRRRSCRSGDSGSRPTAFYADDLDAEVARVLDETLAVLKKEGAEIVKVELPISGQLTAACQLVLATEAAALHKRRMIERPQDYGAQVLMRFRTGSRFPPSPISRRCAGGSGTGGVSRRGARDPMP